jgi:Arc/MetJ-type ribon-helix-helix transcriptional regulator
LPASTSTISGGPWSGLKTPPTTGVPCSTTCGPRTTRTGGRNPKRLGADTVTLAAARAEPSPSGMTRGGAMPRSAVVVSFQCPSDLLAGVDRMVAERGTSRSEVIRAALARDLDPPERMALPEALDLLDAAARRGDLRALLATVKRPTREHAAPPADAFADLPAAA